MPTLAHALVTSPSRPPASPPIRWMLFLHGIFGSGSNWRTFARRWVDARPDWGAVLVDLRLHGRSLGFDAPHSLKAAAGDLLALLPSIPGPVAGVVGHSFGAKVALELVAELGGALDEAWIVDGAPGARPDRRGSEDTTHVLDLVESLPRTFAARTDFHQALETAGIGERTTEWLAKNVAAADGGGYRFKLDLRAIRAMLQDYFERDLWPIVEDPPGRVRIDLVVGGQSSAFDAVDRERAARAAARRSERVRVHTIENAGHWVHVDAPDALLALLIAKGTRDQAARSSWTKR